MKYTKNDMGTRMLILDSVEECQTMLSAFTLFVMSKELDLYATILDAAKKKDIKQVKMDKQSEEMINQVKLAIEDFEKSKD